MISKHVLSAFQNNLRGLEKKWANFFPLFMSDLCCNILTRLHDKRQDRMSSHGASVDICACFQDAIISGIEAPVIFTGLGACSWCHPKRVRADIAMTASGSSQSRQKHKFFVWSGSKLPSAGTPPHPLVIHWLWRHPSRNKGLSVSL